MKPVFVPKTPHDTALQRALMQWRKPQNRKLVLEALHKTGREDLIGFGKRCLIRPDSPGKKEEGTPGKRAAGPGTKGSTRREKEGRGRTTQGAKKTVKTAKNIAKAPKNTPRSGKKPLPKGKK